MRANESQKSDDENYPEKLEVKPKHSSVSYSSMSYSLRESPPGYDDISRVDVMPSCVVDVESAETDISPKKEKSKRKCIGRCSYKFAFFVLILAIAVVTSVFVTLYVTNRINNNDNSAHGQAVATGLNDINDKLGTIHQNIEHIASLKTRIENLEVNDKRHEKMLHKIGEQIADLRKELVQTLATLNKHERNLTAVWGMLDQLENSDINAKARVQNLNNDVTSLKVQVDRLGTSHDGSSSQIETLRQETSSLQSQLHAFSSTIAQLRVEVEKAKASPNAGIATHAHLSVYVMCAVMYFLFAK